MKARRDSQLTVIQLRITEKLNNLKMQITEKRLNYILHTHLPFGFFSELILFNLDLYALSSHFFKIILFLFLIFPS